MSIGLAEQENMPVSAVLWEGAGGGILQSQTGAGGSRYATHRELMWGGAGEVGLGAWKRPVQGCVSTCLAARVTS